jgi:flagellar basal body rod protein FlgC
LTAQKPADVVVKQVALQNTQTRQLVNAQLTDVVVSDLVTVEAQTVAEYNVAHPDNAIEVS